MKIEPIEGLETRLLEGLQGADLDLVMRALQNATEAHAGALRRHGAPYIEHPLAVAVALKEEFGVSSPQVFAAALLHDTIEDTELTEDSLRDSFPEEVVRLVVLVTDPSPRMNSDERREYYLQIWQDPDATLIKVSDRMCNLRDAVRAQNASFARHYLRRTWNEMLRPGLPPWDNLSFRAPLLRAVKDLTEFASPQL